MASEQKLASQLANTVRKTEILEEKVKIGLERKQQIEKLIQDAERRFADTMTTVKKSQTKERTEDVLEALTVKKQPQKKK